MMVLCSYEEKSRCILWELIEIENVRSVVVICATVTIILPYLISRNDCDQKLMDF